MNFPEPTADESTLQCYSDCYKSDYGIRPHGRITPAEAQAWLDDRAARIDANVAAGRPMFAGVGFDDEPMTPDLADDPSVSFADFMAARERDLLG